MGSIGLLLHVFVLNAQNKSIIGYESLWRIVEHNTGNAIVIAVIDGGVKIDHEGLKGGLWQNPIEEMNGNDDDENGYIDDMYGWNFDNNSNDISIGGMGNWHGTPVNGIIRALVNNPYAAINPDIKIVNLVKGDSLCSILKSFEYLCTLKKQYLDSDGLTGANIVVVNCSWGKFGWKASDYPKWCSLINEMGSLGILLVSSVPNFPVNIDFADDLPGGCNSSFQIRVANSLLDDQLAMETAYGKYSVDLTAPGEGSVTTLNQGGYGVFGGTSAAAPYVSAAIGLLMNLPSDKLARLSREYPEKTALLVRQAILEGVDKHFLLEGKVTTGGRINMIKSARLLLDYINDSIDLKDYFDGIKITDFHPNPTYDRGSVLIESDKNQNVFFKLSDGSGRHLKSGKLDLDIGINNFEFDLSQFPRGVLLIRFFTPTQILQTKILLR